MVGVGLALGVLSGTHVAIGTAVCVAVLAALAKEGLHLGVLNLDLLNAGAGVGVVYKGLAVGEVGAVVVVYRGEIRPCRMKSTLWMKSLRDEIRLRRVKARKACF